MKNTLVILAVILVVSVTASMVFARGLAMGKNLPAVTAANRMEYKDMLKNYMSPINHGSGIGISGDTYVTAKWYIANVRMLNVSTLKEIIGNSTATTWSGLRQDMQGYLQNASVLTQGRIEIGNTTYLLSNVNVTNSTATADIKNLPNYASCKQSNVTVQECENNAAKVGDMSLAKKTAIQDNPMDTRVWAGTLDINSVAYNFVTFVYPVGK
jgi:hypothetical protein